MADTSARLIEPHAISLRFRSMNEAEFAALVADIRTNGLREPIVLYEGQILDGRHRYRACWDAGVEPRFELFEGDAKAAGALAESLNVHRRHLTIAERRALVMEELKRDPAQSDRSIAKKAMVDHKSVGELRRVAVAGGEIPHRETIVGSDGIAQPVKKPRGLRPGTKRRTDRAEEIRNLVASGHNVDQIAEAQGISAPQVRNIMRAESIKIAIPKTATTHASAQRVSAGTVDMLVGAAQGLEIFRESGLRLSGEFARSLLPDLRDAMRSMRWFEQQLKEAANG
jgi:ParB-like chromosome segregation protein Spo0J